MPPARFPSASLTHRRILALAVPVMLSNVSTPLIGVVDTGIVGRIPDPAYIGAVALGALVFTFVFWGFGFLRMGTTGLAAQALGAGDDAERVAILLRALLVAGASGAALILLQWPIREAAFGLLDGSPEVEALARTYFNIRIWAAPVTLANYAILGWFIGQGRTDIGLVLQLLLNVTNIALDALFVLGLGWDVNGVATGTLLAETVAAAAGIAIALKHVDIAWPWARILEGERLGRMLAVNADIMVRSLALIFIFVWFMAMGAAEGNRILAANAILMHFVSVTAYFLDGLAFAAESLVGRALGAGDRPSFRTAARRTTLWAAAIAAAASLVIFGLGNVLVDLLTSDPETRSTAGEYLGWAALAPILGVWAFQLDGIFIGATRTRDMRNAMLVSLGLFLAAWWVLTPWGNHGLWAAMTLHYVARIASLGRYYPALAGSVGLESK